MLTSKGSILITGGAGFIGSHTAVMLIEAGYKILVLDNFSNSYPGVIHRIGQISGREVSYIEGDLLDSELLDSAFKQYQIAGVIHFAGLKSVPQSIKEPCLYYEQNVQGSLNLIQAMQKNGCFNLVFSSSAAVYGDSAETPVTEKAALVPQSPYGRSKHMVELILKDISVADSRWQISILRYFNPVGAHPGGLLGECSRRQETNLFPVIVKVAAGESEKLHIFGGNYATHDGTGVRDYIHVMDLAAGHINALERLSPGCQIYNLGTGKGYSVLEIVRAFESVTGHKVNFEIYDARDGDIGSLFASTRRSEVELNWKAKFCLQRMVEDQWNWHQKNPYGFIEM